MPALPREKEIGVRLAGKEGGWGWRGAEATDLIIFWIEFHCGVKWSFDPRSFFLLFP